MGMKVSFTGINNVSVYKDSNPKEVYFRLEDGIRRTAPAKYYGIVVTCDLTDDKKGSHLKDMYDVFKKTSNYLTDSSNPTKLTFSTEHFDVYTPAGIVPRDSIKINGYPLDLYSANDKLLLPFYTFLARITRELMTMHNNEALNKILQHSNNMISRNAEHFIDEIM